MKSCIHSLDAALRVVVLPNTRWKPLARSYQPGDAPDPDRLRRLMAERGIDLVVLDPLPPPYNPMGRSHPLFAGLDPVRGLAVLLRHRSVDLVISVFESGAFVLLMLRRLFFFKPRVAVWDASIGSTWRPRRLILRFVLPRIDRAFLLSQRQRSATIQQYKTCYPIDVIGYAVDDNFYHPKFNTGGDHILSVGDDTARDYSTLITAVKDLKAAVVLKTAAIPSIQQAPKTAIRIIRARLSFLELRALYASAIAVVIPLRPSDHPSGITSLFEAMAMGKPIIASDVPMVRGYIVANETGIIVPVGDVVKMRQAIDFLLARPDEQRRLGQNARRYLEANLSMVSFADRYAACIRDAVQAVPAQGRNS